MEKTHLMRLNFSYIVIYVVDAAAPEMYAVLLLRLRLLHSALPHHPHERHRHQEHKHTLTRKNLQKSQNMRHTVAMFTNSTKIDNLTINANSGGIKFFSDPVRRREATGPCRAITGIIQDLMGVLIMGATNSNQITFILA